MGETFDVVWPRGSKTVAVTSLAPRLPTLDGAVVGELWDYMFRGDEIFPIIERELAARYPNMTFVPYQTFGTTHGEGEHEVIAAMATKLTELGVDAVVSGMGC